jgi:hypothetical protein
MNTPTKLEHAEIALDYLQRAHGHLFSATADLGTPEEIEAARHLTRLAVRELALLSIRHAKDSRAARAHARLLK